MVYRGTSVVNLCIIFFEVDLVSIYCAHSCILWAILQNYLHDTPTLAGHVGWGISWYINGLLIPEINVVRGKTYTFVVEGGLDPETPARYHPFYITDDPVGGYEHKTPEERAVSFVFSRRMKLHVVHCPRCS